MTGRVLDAADVEIDRKPGLGALLRERCRGVVRVRVPVEVPGRIDERVHGVRLATARPSAARARNGDESRGRGERGPGGAAQVHVREQHGEVLLGYRDRAAPLA